MLQILLITNRRESLHSFIEALLSDPEVYLDQLSSETEALSVVRTKCPNLVIIDSGSFDTDALDLVRVLITANAMVNTAVLSVLSDADFHDKSEGLGVLCRLPFEPGSDDAGRLLRNLRGILGLASPLVQ